MQVSELYGSIQHDARHKDVALLHFEEIFERRFSGWSMGQVNVSKLNHSILLKYSEKPELDPTRSRARSRWRCWRTWRPRPPSAAAASVLFRAGRLRFLQHAHPAQADPRHRRRCRGPRAAHAPREVRIAGGLRGLAARAARLDRRLRLPFRPAARTGGAPGWPTGWRECMRHYAASRGPQIRETFAAFCAAGPPVPSSRTAASTSWPAPARP